MKVILPTPLQRVSAVGLGLAALQSPLLASPQGGSQGPNSTWPVGLLVEDASGDPAIRLKAPGNQTPPTSGGVSIPLISPANAPVGSGPVSFRSLNGVNGIPSCDLDAISSGNAVIGALELSSQGEGIPTIPFAWMTITASIAKGKDPFLTGPFEKAAITRDVGSELVSYAFHKSTTLPKGLIGQATLDSSRMDLGLPESGLEDVQGLDYGIGVRSFNLPIETTQFFDNSDRVYFSVSKAFAADTNNNAFALPHSSQPLPPNATKIAADAADIYVSEFSGGAWGPIEVFIPGVFLGFVPTKGDIDAFDLDTPDEVSAVRIIFSATKTSDYIASITDVSQLMIMELPYDFVAGEVTLPPTLNPTPLRDWTSATQSQLVTSGLGIADSGGGGPIGTIPDESEVDGICVIDPETTTFGSLVGIPQDKGGDYDDVMGISVVRHLVHDNPNGQHMIQGTGWGQVVPQECFAQLWRRRLPVPGAGGTAWQLLEVVRRYPIDGVVEYTVEAPLDRTASYAYRVQLRLPQPFGVIGGSLTSEIR